MTLRRLDRLGCGVGRPQAGYAGVGDRTRVELVHYAAGAGCAGVQAGDGVVRDVEHPGLPVDGQATVDREDGVADGHGVEGWIHDGGRLVGHAGRVEVGGGARLGRRVVLCVACMGMTVLI